MIDKKIPQQEFLRDAAKTLGLTQMQFAQRMGAPWDTFRKWLLPNDAASDNAREMPPIAWQLVREILAHEKLKKEKPRSRGTTRAA